MKFNLKTLFYNPEPFPINTFVDDLQKSEEVEVVKVITSLPNYRKYRFYDNFSIIGPYKETNNKIDITRLPVIPRLSNSVTSILLFYLSFLDFYRFLTRQERHGIRDLYLFYFQSNY